MKTNKQGCVMGANYFHEAKMFPKIADFTKYSGFEISNSKNNFELLRDLFVGASDLFENSY